MIQSSKHEQSLSKRAAGGGNAAQRFVPNGLMRAGGKAAAEYAPTLFPRYREGRMMVRRRVGDLFVNSGGTAEAF